MKSTINKFSLIVATSNGSGSQSANNIFVRTLFRLGLPVVGKNLFPSNIQGLPTWFSIRVDSGGNLSRKLNADIVICMNEESFQQDFHSVQPNGYFIYNSDLKLDDTWFNGKETSGIQIIPIPFKSIAAKASSSIKTRKLIENIVYVGLLCAWLEIPEEKAVQVVRSILGSKGSLVDDNLKALSLGFEQGKLLSTSHGSPFRIQEIVDGNAGKILIDGNTATAMGLLFGGCTVVSWYPITPSTSVVENFQKLNAKYRQAPLTPAAVIQAEDELSAIAMVVGAGWAGARAMTATSGPGLSLMAEAAGLSYFAEIPAVIWNVQRVGPSTGLPTRTMQGDVLSAAFLSHGDTRHVLLFPNSPGECFEFAQLCFDLSERLQTLVIVLSDLDIGMNFSIAQDFTYPQKSFDRGKVLSEEQLLQLPKFKRYLGDPTDGIAPRTLPGMNTDKAAHFTRGTGHNSEAKYSESPEDYLYISNRLKQKLEFAKTIVPAPEIHLQKNSKKLLVYYGSSTEACLEFLKVRVDASEIWSSVRIKAYPFSEDLQAVFASHEQIWIAEQNRDAQMRSLLSLQFVKHAAKMRSLLQYDGLPMSAEHLLNVYEEENSKSLSQERSMG